MPKLYKSKGHRPIATEQGWTVGKDGRTNSSPLFEKLVDEVTNMIRDDAHQLLAGNAHMTARLILAQLTHVHGLEPRRPHGQEGT